MIRKLLSLTASLLLLTMVQLAFADKVYDSVKHRFTVNTVVEGLEVPWSMAWLPNGDMLITEREGNLRIFGKGELSEPLKGVPKVHAVGQGGLFDVLPDANFSSNRIIYLSFAKPLSKGSTIAVAKAQLIDGELVNVEEIFVAKSSGKGHYGGKLAIDDDNFMYVTVGDRQASPSGDLTQHPAQLPSNHHGVVVRLNTDGSIPKDNHFVGTDKGLAEIYSYGHRNPQGMAVHPKTGDLWVGEHGPQGGDELNIVEAGKNYGWPVIGYGVNYGAGKPIHESQTREGMETPLHFWVPSIASSGLLIYSGDKFPKWRGNIFVGGLRGEQLARVILDAEAKKVVGEETLVKGLGRVRDVRQGPDGYIYLADETNGKIVRLEPAD